MRVIYALIIAALPAIATAQDKWIYDSHENKMSGKSVGVAYIPSATSLDFKFPYNGQNIAMLMLANKSRGAEVMLSIQKGQIPCFQSCTINVRFDNKKQMKFTGSASADGSRNIVFINNEKKFIAEAKSAKRILVQATIYGEGAPVIEFTPSEPLVWPPTL